MFARAVEPRPLSTLDSPPTQLLPHRPWTCRGCRASRIFEARSAGECGDPRPPPTTKRLSRHGEDDGASTGSRRRHRESNRTRSMSKLTPTASRPILVLAAGAWTPWRPPPLCHRSRACRNFATESRPAGLSISPRCRRRPGALSGRGTSRGRARSRARAGRSTRSPCGSARGRRPRPRSAARPRSRRRSGCRRG